jgi:DUF1365 family protein
MNNPSMLIRGFVMHQRLRPVMHRFVYPVFFIRINLKQAEENKSSLSSFLFGINQWRPMSFHFKDHGPRNGNALLPWIKNILTEHELPSDGDVFLQAFPRVFGYVFNPISIWYCYDKDENLVAILAEVNNTFGEHHLYFLYDKKIQKSSTTKQNRWHFNSQKAMHVSPFCEVKGHYKFTFKEREKTCLSKIDYYDSDECLLKTAISADKLAFNKSNLFSALLAQPFLTFGVMFRIHWNALILWVKRVPVFRLPIAPDHQISTNFENTEPNLYQKESKE